MNKTILVEGSIVPDQKKFNELLERFGEPFKIELDKQIEYFNRKPFRKERISLWFDKFKESLDLINLDYEEQKEIEEESKAKHEEYNLKERFLSLVLGKNKNVAEGTEIIVEYILKQKKIYTTKEDLKSEMWVYHEGIYVPNGKSEVKIIMRRILEEWFNIYFFNQVISKIETDTFIETDEFFKTNYKNEIPVQNGILNIVTREITDFTPNKIFFNKLPIEYEPKAKCPMVEKFLDDVLAKPDDKLVFFELGGSALSKEYKYEKAFMFHGNGRNGKGKTIDLLRRTIGPENCVSIPLTALTPDSFQVSELFGKMLNLAGDLSSKDLKDTGMFKSLTGRDLINGKRKFLRDISFENYAKFVFACNDLPMVYDLSRGFWERWVLLDFPYYFADKEKYDSTPEHERKNWKIRDPEILNKITTPEELSGLLNQFLEGYRRLERNGKFSVTEGSEDIKNRWIRRANSFIAFCMDKIEEDGENRIIKKKLRKEYTKYCKLHKVGGKSDVVIKSVIQEMFGASEERININSNTFGQYDYEWAWVGVRWKK